MNASILTVDPTLTPRPFDAEENRLTDQLARGHRMRHQHRLEGVWEYRRDGSGMIIRELRRTCCDA